MIKAIIFDIDGVLADSLASNARYMKDVLKLAGYRFSVKQYRNMFHLSMWDIIKKVTKLHTAADIKKIQERAKKMPDRPEYFGRPTPFSQVIIKSLATRYKIALVSSRIRKNITHDYFIIAPRVQKYLTTFVGYEDTKHHKPHPEPLLVAARRLKVRPDECVYVGDAPTDAQAARRAGIRFIAYGRRIPNPQYSIRSLKTLPRLIRELDS